MTWLVAQNKQDFFLRVFLLNLCLCADISHVCALAETQTSMKQQLFLINLPNLISFLLFLSYTCNLDSEQLILKINSYFRHHLLAFLLADIQL